jgi:hypothetical protein
MFFTRRTLGANVSDCEKCGHSFRHCKCAIAKDFNAAKTWSEIMTNKQPKFDRSAADKAAQEIADDTFITDFQEGAYWQWKQDLRTMLQAFGLISKMRAQWINSVHKDECLAFLKLCGRTDHPELKDEK